MAQDIISRQQPKYWQGSIRWLTNTEKRKLRRQNAKDAGKWGLASIYNALTDLPNRIAKVPVAAVDQIAWTDIQWAMDKAQSAPIQALKDSASNTKAFDKWSEAADALVWIAALLWAWKVWWSNTVKNTNIPKYVEMTNNPKGVSKGFTTTEIWNWYKGFNVKDMPAYAQKRVANMYNEAHPTWPKKANFAWVTREWEVPNNSTFARYIPDKWQELADINKTSRESWISKDTLRYAQDYLNNTKWWAWSIKEVADYLKNTSKARAEKLKNSNRSRAERTLLKKTERDAQQALDDVYNLSLEKMYNQWKNLNRQ